MDLATAVLLTSFVSLTMSYSNGGNPPQPDYSTVYDSPQLQAMQQQPQDQTAATSEFAIPASSSSLSTTTTIYTFPLKGSRLNPSLRISHRAKHQPSHAQTRSRNQHIRQDRLNHHSLFRNPLHTNLFQLQRLHYTHPPLASTPPLSQTFTLPMTAS